MVKEKGITLYGVDGKVLEMSETIDEFQTKYLNEFGEFKVRLIRSLDTKTGSRSILFTDHIVQVIENK